MTVYVVTDGWRYYGGLSPGVCDVADPADALQLEDRDLPVEFPDGLPQGWCKVDARDVQASPRGRTG